MATSTPSLLLKFRSTDTAYGVTRDTVKDLAARFDMTETQVIHIALSRLAKEELPAYEADEGPLSERDAQALRKIAAKSLPKGKVLKSSALF